MGCVFCAIAAGTAAASVVHEDDVALAFMDIRPLTTGHILVVPRTHTASLAELDPETGGHLFRVAQQVAARLRGSGVRCDGVNIFLADGAAAGQDVAHVHLHVLPRFEGDTIVIEAAGGLRVPGRPELAALAERLRF